MAIEALEILACRDYDRRRGQSLWLIARFPTHIGKSHYIPAWACRQMTEATRAAYIKEHGEEPLLIQNIEGSAWWRAGPVEEDDE